MIRCNTRRACPTVLETENILSESGWSLRAEHLLGVLLGDSVGEREAQALLSELADVGSLDILGLLELDDAEDLVLGLAWVRARPCECDVRGST